MKKLLGLVFIFYSSIGSAIPPLALHERPIPTEDEIWARIEQVCDIAENLIVDGHQISDPNQFAQDFVFLEQVIYPRRVTSDHLIGEFAAQEIRERIRRRRFRCFTGAMRALTPRGYVALASLKVGDKVMSWDLEDQRLVANEISEVFDSPGEVAYGRLKGAAPYRHSIEVAPEYPFYLPLHQNYHPIGSIAAEHLLLQIDVDSCEANLIARGEYELNAGQAKVRTLRMKSAPFNFVLEGLVVHSPP